MSISIFFSILFLSFIYAGVDVKIRIDVIENSGSEGLFTFSYVHRGLIFTTEEVNATFRQGGRGASLPLVRSLPI